MLGKGGGNQTTATLKKVAFLFRQIVCNTLKDAVSFGYRNEEIQNDQQPNRSGTSVVYSLRRIACCHRGRRFKYSGHQICAKEGVVMNTIVLSTKQARRIRKALKSLEEVRLEVSQEYTPMDGGINWYVEDNWNLTMMNGESHDRSGKSKQENIIERFDFKYASGGGF